MAYTIPASVRARWRQLAQQSGSTYATIVGQHVYDIQTEIDTLTEALATQQQAVSEGAAAAQAKIAALTTQLAHARDQLAAYKAEQQGAGGESG